MKTRGVSWTGSNARLRPFIRNVSGDSFMDLPSANSRVTSLCRGVLDLVLLFHFELRLKH
jgi:hypothetical protein